MDAETARLPFSMFHSFYNVWHAGLLHKIKNCFLPDLYIITKSYLLQRLVFRAKFGEVVTQLRDVNTEVPQSSVLGPVLYLLCTTNFPVTLDIIIATYADDTAILAAHKDYIVASECLHKSLFYIHI